MQFDKLKRLRVDERPPTYLRQRQEVSQYAVATLVSLVMENKGQITNAVYDPTGSDNPGALSSTFESKTTRITGESQFIQTIFLRSQE
jgi:hypothetical protein